MVQLTNNSGVVTKTYTYDAFGNEKNPNPYDTNVFRYCGEYFDKETGTIYLRVRYYSPRIGRFITEDPIRDGLNWYVYTDNNPVNRWDPSGRAWTDQDKKEYNRLMAGSKEDQARAKTFKNEVDGATNDWNNAGGDIYRENNARYRAVQVRQAVYANGYVDDFNYIRGNEVLVFVGTHNVAGVGNHAGVIIMASSGHTNSLWGGKVSYTTLGAGPERDQFNNWGNLLAESDRPGDVRMSNKNAMILVSTSKGDADNLITRHNNFVGNDERDRTLPYNPKPNGTTTFNSNSYTRGLLGNLAPALPRGWWFPGWNGAVPANMFN